MAELVEIMEEGEGLGALFESSEIGTVEEGLTEAEAAEMSEINAAADDIVKITEDDLKLLENPEEDFEAAEQNGDFSEAEKNADVSEAEAKELEVSEEQAAKVKTDFKAYLNKGYKLFKGFIESPVGKGAMEAVGAYFKFKFIVDMTNLSFADIDKIVKDAKGNEPAGLTDAQLKTRTTLLNFLQFVVAVSKIVKGCQQSLQNAATFSTSDGKDSGGDGSTLAGNMTVNQYKELMDAVQNATDAASLVLANIGAAYKALGYTDTAGSNAMVNAVVQNPTLLTNSISAISTDKIDDFMKKLTALSSLSTKIINKDFEGDDKAKMELFFRLPDGWKDALVNLENFLK